MLYNYFSNLIVKIFGKQGEIMQQVVFTNSLHGLGNQVVFIQT